MARIPPPKRKQVLPDMDKLQKMLDRDAGLYGSMQYQRAKYLGGKTTPRKPGQRVPRKKYSKVRRRPMVPL